MPRPKRFFKKKMKVRDSDSLKIARWEDEDLQVRGQEERRERVAVIPASPAF